MLPEQTVFAHQGEVLALGAALFWAVAVILFRITGRSVSPLSLNLFKCTFCIGLFLITSWILREPLLPDVPLKVYGIMLLSGLVGIGVSDTLFFASLNRLGAGFSAIVNCSYSPLVIILAAIFLAERMRPLQLAGVGMIIGAVLMVSRAENDRSPIRRRDLLSGVALGLAAMLSMAVSIVIMKPYLPQVPVLWATLMRTVGGLALLAVVFSLHSRRGDFTAELRNPRLWLPLAASSFFGGYLAFTAWMGGMKYTLASTAAALNQMSTIFIFVLGVVILKESVTRGKIAALVLAVGGVVLITFSR
jgi:drug/metabolite transporter (DMT)-like permease